jgi:hypothetical protein
MTIALGPARRLQLIPTTDAPSYANLRRHMKRIAQSNTVYTPVLEREQPCLGAYAFVLRGGAVSVGDAVVFA